MTDLYQEHHNRRSEMLYSSILGEHPLCENNNCILAKLFTAKCWHARIWTIYGYGWKSRWKLNFFQAVNVSKPCSQDWMSVWFNDWTYNWMFGHSLVHTFKCSAVQTFSCSDVQLNTDSDVQLFRRSTVQTFSWTNVQTFRRSDVQMFNCSDGLTAYQSNKQSIVWMNNRSNDRSWTTFGYGWQSESKYKLFRKRLCFPNKRPSSELRK